MISRIIVRFLGGIWKVKLTSQHSKFYKTVYDYYQFQHGSSISVDAEFANEPTFPRGMKQIVIGKGVEVGENCVIYHQVTIDGELLPNNSPKAKPIIGNNCYIYPGAKIIGSIVIGDNVIISPNAVIMQDVPSNTSV